MNFFLMCDHARFVTLLIRLPASQGVYGRISLVPKSYIPYIYIRSHDVQYNGFVLKQTRQSYFLPASCSKNLVYTLIAPLAHRRSVKCTRPRRRALLIHYKLLIAARASGPSRFRRRPQIRILRQPCTCLLQTYGTSTFSFLSVFRN
jgi:hypothetical protein